MIELDYPPAARDEPRWGWGKAPHRALESELERHEQTFRRHLSALREFGTDLRAIPGQQVDEVEPFWSNTNMSGLDGASIYCHLRRREPACYLEIGSGNSTKFAARAKRDGGLATRLVSIDPEPRFGGVDALCDETIRQPLENADLAAFARLRAGDVVFFDGSHRVFMNSDVAVFFLDVMPRLPAGVLVGIHDIFLPDDYPADWAPKYYSEQYLLAAHLLAGPSGSRPELANHFVSTRQPLRDELIETWREIGLEPHNAYGSAFWLETD